MQPACRGTRDIRRRRCAVEETVCHRQDVRGLRDPEPGVGEVRRLVHRAQRNHAGAYQRCRLATEYRPRQRDVHGIAAELFHGEGTDGIAVEEPAAAQPGTEAGRRGGNAALAIVGQRGVGGVTVAPAHLVQPRGVERLLEVSGIAGQREGAAGQAQHREIGAIGGILRCPRSGRVARVRKTRQFGEHIHYGARGDVRARILVGNQLCQVHELALPASYGGSRADKAARAAHGGAGGCERRGCRGGRGACIAGTEQQNGARCKQQGEGLAHRWSLLSRYRSILSNGRSL